MIIKQHDLEPPIRMTLTDKNDAGATIPVDLTGADTISVVGVLNGAQVFKRTATGTADGKVTMPWQAGDTDTAGRIYVEVEVIWPGNRPQTFRPDAAVDVTADLG